MRNLPRGDQPIEGTISTRSGGCRVRMLTTGMMLLFVSGCTSMLVGGATYQSDDDERSQSAASDTAITSEIRNSFAADPVVAMFNIGVRTYAGAVTLSGTVSSYAAQEQAGQIAKGADGVKIVHNHIKVE